MDVPAVTCDEVEIVQPLDSNKTRHRVYKTTCLYLVYFCLGLALSLFGATLVQIEVLYQTDTQTVSWVFTCVAVGYVLGASLCGAIYDILNTQLMCTCATLAAGTFLAFAPFCTNIYGFFAMTSLSGCSLGFLTCAGQPFVLSLWEDGHIKRRPLAQGLACIWSIGAAICPVVIQPFLVKLNRQETSALTPCNNTQGNDLSIHINITNVSHTYAIERPATNNNGCCDDVGRVRWAYFVTGSFLLLPSVLFLLSFLIEKPYTFRNRTTVSGTDLKQGTGGNKSTLSKYGTIGFLSLMAVFLFAYCATNLIPAFFLPTFTVNELCWTNKQSTMLLSVLWGCQGIARLIGVPVSALLAPSTMLIADLGMQLTAFFMMIFVRHHDIITWVAASLAGFSTGTIYVTTILWVSTHMSITGKVGAVLAAPEFAAGTVLPLLAGYIFQKVSPMVVVFLPLTASIIMAIIFCVASFVFRKTKKTNETIGNGIKLEETESLKNIPKD